MVEATTPDAGDDSDDGGPVERPPSPEEVRAMQEAEAHSSDDELTRSKNVRWEWLATVVAGLTILSFILLVIAGAFGVVTLSFSQPWFLLYSSAVVASYGWVLGKDYINLGK